MVVQKWKKKDEMRIQWATRNEKNENTVDETHNKMEMKRMRKWK